MKYRRRRLGVLLLTVLSIGAATYLQPWRQRLEVGGVRINPHAAIDPEKDYVVTVWDWELPILWHDTSHAQALREAAAACTAQHPNINIALTVYSWDEGDQYVRDALARGNPPDVLGMPRGVRLLAPELQVPLESFLTPEEKNDITAPAQSAATWEHHLWAVPRWLNPMRWVIHAERWPELRQEGDAPVRRALPFVFTKAQWEENMAEARTKNGSIGLALNALDPAFFYGLMVAAAGTGYLAPDGAVQWSEETIEQVARMLQTWVKKGFIPNDVEAAARRRLGDFWSGNAVALAPTNSWLLHHLYQRSGMLDAPAAASDDTVLTRTVSARLEEVHRSVLWTIPPLMRNHAAVAATVSGFAVFRQAEYKGDDHTQAAVTTARCLARRLSVWEATQLFAVPTYYSAIDAWITDSRLPEQDLYALLTWSEAAVVPPLDDRIARLEERIMQETALPALVRLLQGELTPASFARELITAPLGALAEVHGP